MVIMLFAILPVLLLILYSFCCYQNLLNLLPVRWHILHRDGTQHRVCACRGATCPINWLVPHDQCTSTIELCRIFNFKPNGQNFQFQTYCDGVSAVHDREVKMEGGPTEGRDNEPLYCPTDHPCTCTI